MKTQKNLTVFRALAAGFWLALTIAGSAQTKAFAKGEDRKEPEGYKISGPYAHENLSIFLIHGHDKIKSKSFLTLQEAMGQKKVVVHETSNVNELAVENLSAEEVYIQSGDIVKGGKQDRVISYDFIVPAKSGKIPISSFCVEQGRWRPRGREAVQHFSTSDALLATKDLKLATRHQKAQGEVWKQVAVAQTKLAATVGAPVHSDQSASSLQLTLENKQVQQTSDRYVRNLLPIVKGKRDVIGYAFAINGRINSADVYASSALFKKLWPKLLRASAVEAIADFHKERKSQSATVEHMKSFLSEAEKGKPSEKEVTGRIKMVTQETEKTLLFETQDREMKEVWIHRNYLVK